MLEADALVGGKYRVVRALGAGGMATVHEAVHVGTKGRVALKVLGEDAKRDASAAGRFAREARASGRLRSRHVARVMDVDALPDGTPYLVMEYLEGHDLAREIKRRGPLPVHKVATIAVQVAAGIAEAHAHDIIHRDLKPGNVFLAQEGATRVVKVLDFGISKILTEGEDEELTRTSSNVGTPAYMSPEQIRSPKDVDSATDVWATGVLLFRMLTGQLPFVGNTSSIAVSICHDEPIPLASVRRDVPPELAAMIDLTLSKERRQRPSIADIAEHLLTWVGTGPEAALARDAAVEIAARNLPRVRPIAPLVAPLEHVEPTVAGTTHATPTVRASKRFPFAWVAAAAALAVAGASFVLARSASSPTPGAATPSNAAGPVGAAPLPSALAAPGNPTAAPAATIGTAPSATPSAPSPVPSPSASAAARPASAPKPKATPTHAPVVPVPARL